MGKKEKNIKKLNTEYYNEQNRDEKDFNSFKSEEDIRFKQELELENKEYKFNKVVNNVKKNMFEYIDHQGLALLENLNHENLENYVQFVINGCPKSKYTKNTPEIDEEQIIEFELKPVQIKKNNTNEKEIIHHGMKILEHDYFTDHGKLPDHFHNRLVAQYGINEYYDTIINLGTEYFDKTRRDVANKLGYEAALAAGVRKQDTFKKIKWRKK